MLVPPLTFMLQRYVLVRKNVGAATLPDGLSTDTSCSSSMACSGRCVWKRLIDHKIACPRSYSSGTHQASTAAEINRVRFLDVGYPGGADDPNVATKQGRVFGSSYLAEEDGVNDAGGTRPHFV